MVLLSGGSSKGAGDLAYQGCQPSWPPWNRGARRGAQTRKTYMPGGDQW